MQGGRLIPQKGLFQLNLKVFLRACHMQGALQQKNIQSLRPIQSEPSRSSNDFTVQVFMKAKPKTRSPRIEHRGVLQNFKKFRSQKQYEYQEKNTTEEKSLNVSFKHEKAFKFQNSAFFHSNLEYSIIWIFRISRRMTSFKY